MVSISGNALYQIAQACAQELGAFGAVSTSSASGAANLLTATGTIDVEAPTGKYGGHYLYNLSGDAPLLGQQGRVLRNGYAGTTGVFTVSANFTANPQAGADWLLLGAMPMLDQDGLVGLRACINRALRKFWVLRRVTFAATSGLLTYDLGSMFWAAKDRFKRLYDPDPGTSGHPVPASQAWEVVQDGETWSLNLGTGYATGETFSLLAEHPANAYLKLSGVWAAQASPLAGLVIPLDACLGEWNHVFQCALYECCKQLAVQAGGNRKSYWEQRAAEQRGVVAAIKAYQLDDGGDALGEGQSEAPSSWSGLGDKGIFSGRAY